MSISKEDKASPEMALEQVIARYMSNLWAGMKSYGKEPELYRISFTWRGDDDYLAIAGRLSPTDGRPEVLFASGDSYSNAFRQLNNAIRRGKWKPDKFAK